MAKSAKNNPSWLRADFFRWILLPFIIPAALMPSSAAADSALLDIAPTTFFEDIFSWEQYSVRVGPGMVFSPDYEGSSSYKARLVPVVNLRWKQVAYFHDKSLRINLVHKDGLRLGPIFSYSTGRPENENANLSGLGDVGSGMEVGGFAEQIFGPVALRLDIQKEIAGGHGGLIAHVETGFLFHKTEKLSLITGARATYAGGNYMTSFFGVSGAQSLASGLPMYRAKAGLKDLGVALLANYLINDNWSTGGVLGCARLLGSAAHNPLVQERGTPNQCMGFIRLTYQL